MTKPELEALKARVDADDPAAMYAYAEFIRASNPAESEKYIVLSAQLGNANAQERLGDKYHALGDLANAEFYYKTAARSGVLDCAVKLAVMNLSVNEFTALHELEDLARTGVKSACSALAAYYKAKGNRIESAFWHSLIK